MMRIVLIFTFLYYNCAFAQDNATLYRCEKKWLIDSLQTLNLGKTYDGIHHFMFNDERKLIHQMNFTKDSVLLLDAILIDLDSSIYEPTSEIFFTYSEKVVTYYSDGKLRSSYSSSRNQIESRSYSHDGRLLYHNLIKIDGENRDTLMGVFRVDSYYDWIRFDVFEKGQKRMQVQVPIRMNQLDAVNVKIDRNLKNNCLEDFCVTQYYEKLKKKKVSKYKKMIRQAIEDGLITSLDACYYQ